MNNILKKFANDQATAEMDFEILRYTQPASMTLMQNTDDLFAKSCKVVDISIESILNNISIEGVNSSICRSLREY